ncbi:MAG: hypothetical protein KC656_22710 [Myxococcales bacterium]|nr:hypothetical protein [Myxococcales bacterium]MCB9670619.1 hypothetical protein [Alphaproteobacteria bacterium]
MGSMRTYGAWTGNMLGGMREDGLLKVEAFVAWLDARGVQVDRSLVSHWCAGRTHLPADLLPLLAEFSGDTAAVFGPFVRDLGWELVRIPDAPVTDEDLVDLMLSASAHLGRLHEALAHARSPDSPGGVAITADERAALQDRVDALIHLLADVRRRLG